MFSYTFDIYFIDLDIVYQIFVKNWWHVLKILFMSYVVFYWVPTKIFPQEHTGKGIEKIIFNMVYMVAYSEVVIAFLIAIKIFSTLLFIITLILTKLAFMQWYYKKDILWSLSCMKTQIIIGVLNFFDNPQKVKKIISKYIKNRLLDLQKSTDIYTFFKYFLISLVLIFVVFVVSAKCFYSYSDAAPDTSQFIEWVGFLQKNQLYAPNKTFGADFYGISVMIFFVNLFTNLDQIVLFPIYPVLLIIALYLSIYYVVKDFTGSRYSAIFAVMIHGLILMSPLSDYILGKVVETSSPQLIYWHGLHFYLPTLNQLADGLKNGYIPYSRYTSGMAYEHSSVFVLLNIYFLIKTLQVKLDRYLFMYGLTLLLVFTFHGGGAIVLVVMSLLVAINALFFRKIDKNLLKKGSLSILIASIAGNAWMLSMIEYGIPQQFGAAAPILDKLLKTTNSVKQTVKMGFESVTISEITPIHMALFAMIILAFIFSFFTKRKFVNSSYILAVTGIFLVYFMPNLGLPLLTRHSRLAEYLFFAITLLLSFYYYYFFYLPIYLIFKRFGKMIIIFTGYAMFVVLSFAAPKWLNSNLFWVNINGTEYTSIPDIITQINKTNRPFTWTVISYVQEYAKILNKAYHVNTQNFLLKYNPGDKYLKIPTPKIYIFVENFPNPYKGMSEWFYRWRGDIQNNLKSWITIYGLTHDNIKIYKKTKTVTVYEIDNDNYMKYLVTKSKNEK